MRLVNRYEYYDKFGDFIVFIKVDENCNLDCSFCYQGKKNQRRIDTEEKLKNCFKNLDFGIDRFFEIKKRERYEYATLTICFFGGEATLNPWGISKICEHLKEKYSKEQRDSFFLTITTNGIIFDENIREIFRTMKSVSSLPVKVLISSDNTKEVYDKNRKYKDGKESGFEIVQRHIREYKDFLCELNGDSEGEYVDVATVLATTEQLKNSPDLIKEQYKEINKRGKLLYELSHQEHDYVEESKRFLLKAYGYLIDKLTKENKLKSIDNIMKAVWSLKGEREFHECTHLYAIDGDGNVNWCNKIRGFEGRDDITQDELRDLAIFNPNADNSHFKCYKLKVEGGDVCKNKIRPELWRRTLTKFNPNIPILMLKISDNLDIVKHEKRIYDFIKYIIGSSKGERIIFSNLEFNDKFQKLFEELEITVKKQLKGTNIPNIDIFYLSENGDLFFNEMLKGNEEYVLTNVFERHFMWIHTPTFLKSVNYFFYKKIKELKN